MRSLSLRPGNSPATPYGGRVNGLQVIVFSPPCHPCYGALALTPAGLSPAERASLCWTHKSTIMFPYAKPNPSHLSDPASSILNRPITAARCTEWCTAASSGIVQRGSTAVRRVTRGRSARTGSARRRILAAGAGQDARRQRSNRAGSAATGILAAGAEPDTCGRGGSGPGSAQRGRYSGVAG